ncbi:MAG: DNA methyltransferase, partial [Phenylobacterium zucineum]
VDTAAYSEVLAQAYVVTDAADVDSDELAEALARLESLPDRRGYVTEVFCERARYFHPDNGVRIDAIREGIDDLFADHPLRPLRLAAPELTTGTGRAVRGDALELAGTLDPVDLAYLDPPYNQHRYFTNYHVWETLVRWDAPEHYGVACKRVDAREAATRSPFNSRRTMPDALAAVIAQVRAETMVVSFSNEGFVPLPELVEMCAVRGHPVEVLAFDTRRYIGQRLGVFNPDGRRVGVPGPERNVEYVLISAPAEVQVALATR